MAGLRGESVFVSILLLKPGGGRFPAGARLLCPLGRLPSEASPSVPLHFVEREGPEIEIFLIRQDGSATFPLSTKWRGGQGVRPRRAGRPEAKDDPGLANCVTLVVH